MKQLEKYSDSNLVEETKVLRTQEKEILHELLLYLGEIDGRKLYRDLGYNSFFAYLTEGLGYTEGAACRRSQGARLLREHPELYSKLKKGELSFSALIELSRVKEGEKVEGLAMECSGKSRQEVQRLVAEVAAPIVPKRQKESIRAVRVQSEITATAAVDPGYHVSFQADEEFMALYREAKAIEGGRLMRDVLKKTLKEYTKRNSPKERQKRREARAKKKATPRAALSSEKQSRHVSVPVRDTVYLRDGGRCTYRSPDGRRCSCTQHLEYDHVKPFALGGDHSVGNIRLLCRAHNQLMAERAFGLQFMNDQKLKRSIDPPKNFR